MKSKWVFGLVTVMVVLMMAPSSFAQVQLILTGNPSASEIQTNRTAQTADPTSLGAGILLSGSLLAASPLTTTTLTLSFGAPITSSAAIQGNGVAGAGAIPPSDPIRIEGATGVFAAISAVTSVNYPSGTVTVTLPCWNTTSGDCQNNDNNLSGSFRVVGVRVDVNGKSAPMTVTTSLSSSANNYIPPAQPTVNTINALGPGVGSMNQGSVGSQTNNGTFLVFTNQTGSTPAKGTATLAIAEGFASAWRANTDGVTQESSNSTLLQNGTDIRLTFNGVPRGMTVSASPLSGSSSSNRPTVDTTLGGGGSVLSATASTSAPNPTLTIKFSNTNLSAVENLGLDLTLSGTPSSTLTAGSITVTATMAPIGDGLMGNNQPPTPSSTVGFPRFAQADVGPVTIGTIAAATTTMLIPYAVRVSTYDTGIAIANTTKDPFGSSGGATPASGTIVFNMFPRTDTGVGTAFSVTTSSTVRPGVGLATDGTLAAGGTWTGLMSDILTAAGQSGDFFGYIFIQTNFTFAHGASYIFNGAGFTSASPVLVLPTPASSPRTPTESLSQ
jgi:hypothetical protein